jgi:putative nucleotidyltransferase with HDIG domain
MVNTLAKPPPNPSESADAIGLTIDDYVVQSRIGFGGMGVVFEAIHPVIGKRVAIKVLKPDIAHDPAIATQLVSEARTVNAIGHRGIVDIYDIGTLPDGRQYLVMELLAGSPLDAYLGKRGPLPAPEVLQVLDEVLDALAAVHAAGLVHHDLKPSNIFRVTPQSGEPYLKLLDFGLSRPQPSGQGRHRLLVGTPPYMAPEQLRGELATVQSDLFAVGAIAYELLAGKPAFRGTPEQILRDEIRGVDLSSFSQLHPKIVETLRGLLSADPRKRPASAARVRDELRALRSSLGMGRAGTPTGDVAASEQPELIGRLMGAVRDFFSSGKPAAPRSAPSRRPAPSALELALEDFEVVERKEGPPLEEAALRRVLEATLDHVRGLKSLPTFPAAALRLVKFINHEDAEPAELVRLISQDPALTAQVMRMANSAYFTRGVEIKTVKEAVVRLGYREVAGVATAAATAALFNKDARGRSKAFQEHQYWIWTESLSSAFAASWLALEHRLGDSDIAFTGGMLHDIGKTLAVNALADSALLARLPGFDPELMLGPLLEAMHVEVGARMAEEWKLPSAIARICREHHDPDEGAPRELHAVRIAAAISEMRVAPKWATTRLAEVQRSAELLGLDRHQLRAASAQVRDFVAKAEALIASAARG